MEQKVLGVMQLSIRQKGFEIKIHSAIKIQRDVDR